MRETLLSFSNVLLFGRKLGDIKIVEPPVLPLGRQIEVDLATTGVLVLTTPISSSTNVDGYTPQPEMRVLVKNQEKADQGQQGVYRVVGDRWKRVDLEFSSTESYIVTVAVGDSLGGHMFKLKQDGEVSEIMDKDVGHDPRHNPFSGLRGGIASEIEQQLAAKNDPAFARIYGFSFEGAYCELPRPVLFLVHGPGVPASAVRGAIFAAPRPARAPGDPSRTGIATADFQFSDDIIVWSYDKADYTIRMDVETGMFEDVLLAPALSGDGPDMRGMNVRGMNARGMNVRGMNARGMNVRGGSD